MKRILFGALAVLGMVLGQVPASHAAVNDFTIPDYDIKYELAKDTNNRSELRTIETITADFSNANQNHGIERAIPKSYDGHTVHLSVESVKKPDGSDWKYETRSQNDNTVVRIGDADTYVTGKQTYVITYTQRDVTRFFENTKSDEFYWDTNGTEWRVPIDRLNVQLLLKDGLEDSLSGKSACYKGSAGSNTGCTVTKVSNKLIASASNLKAGENVTIAVAFEPQTFAPYSKTVSEQLIGLWHMIMIGSIPIALVLFVILIVLYSSWTRRSSEKGTIIPEYTPPKEASVTTAAFVYAKGQAGFTAQLLDFAVRDYVKIYETEQKGFLKSAQYDIEIVKDISTLKNEEQEILKDIFDGSVAVGSRLSLKDLKNNSKLYARTRDNDKKLKALVRGEYGLYERDQKKSSWFKRVALWFLILGLLLLNPPLLFVSLIAFSCGALFWRLSDKGLVLSRYLDGLNEYIKVAETDRIKMLQSPEGAEKIGSVNPSDNAQLVKLYEKVLPYAVLFGQEKDWVKRIGDMYESINSNPAWYGGNSAAFSAAAFSSSIGSFNSAASYSSASSSTSGGSSGGGSSGGGGGGGGGGGW